MGINIISVGKNDRALHRKFIRFPHRLYADSSCWVPFLNVDMRSFLTRRHPYFQAYDAQFFMAIKDGEVAGTIEVSYNHSYTKMHKINTAHFFFLDFIDDQEVTAALVQRAEGWARDKGAEYLSGPLLSGGPMGSGILVEGYQYPATMTMMRYNYHYYKQHLETLGYKKMFDLYSYYIDVKKFKMHPKIDRLTELVKKRGHFKSIEYRTKRELIAVTKKVIYEFFNVVLGDHVENYPMTDSELHRIIKDLVVVARPDLVRFITYDGELAGYVVGFPDITEELQRAKGALNPLSIFRLLRAVKNTNRITLNGVGILPQYQRLGGNALLYNEISRACKVSRSDNVELTQIAEATDIMVSEMGLLVDKRIKVHRVMRRKIS